MKKLAVEHYINNNISPEDEFDFVGNVLSEFNSVKESKCYVMGKEFSKQLEKVKLDILSKYLMNIKETLYIEFAENIFLDEDNYFSGCVFCQSNNGYLSISLFSTLERYVSTIGFSVGELIEINGNCIAPSIDDILTLGIANASYSKHSVGLTNIIGNRIAIKKTLSFACNCILYINSGNPDLRLTRTPKCNSKSIKGLKKFIKKYPIESPIVYVGYNHKKKNIYYKDTSEVNGHFRWQPYGKELSKIKLIWINEHIREYNNTYKKLLTKGE